MFYQYKLESRINTVGYQSSLLQTLSVRISNQANCFISIIITDQTGNVVPLPAKFLLVELPLPLEFLNLSFWLRYSVGYLSLSYIGYRSYWYLFRKPKSCFFPFHAVRPSQTTRIPLQLSPWPIGTGTKWYSTFCTLSYRPNLQATVRYGLKFLTWFLNFLFRLPVLPLKNRFKWTHPHP